MTKALRTFVAIEIPRSVREEIDSFLREFRSIDAEVRWEPVRKLHITLRFLGETAESQIADIVRLLQDAAYGINPFSIVFSSTGCFPNKREPRVLWIGADAPSGTLETLAAKVDALMKQAGFEPENKAFHPHVTIARVKGKRNVAHLLRTMESRTFRSQPTEVSQIVLVKSELRPGGSEYSVLHSIPLSEKKSNET